MKKIFVMTLAFMLLSVSSSYAQAYPAIAEGLRAHQDHPYTVAAVHQTLLDLMRGEAPAPVPDATTQSFARPARHSDANGREQLPS